MIGKRWMILAALVALVMAPARAAEDPAPGDTPPPSPEAPAAPAPEAPKPSFWGDSNALFLEFLYGGSDMQDLNTSVLTTAALDTISTLSLDENLFARGTVGWRLPNTRGGFLLSYTAYAGTIDPSVVEPSENLVWWTLHMKDGALAASRTPPVWTPPTVDTGGNVTNPGDDANGNGFPDPDEVRYGEPDAVTNVQVPSSLQNDVQAIDLQYARGFGGRRVAGRWSAGARYFDYQGNVPFAGWLASAPPVFTDGQFLHPVPVRQEASGFGPTGSGEVLTYFFRRRLNLYASVKLSFVLNSLESDTGETFSLAFDDDQNLLVPADLRLQKSLDKNSWQSGFEIGARFQLLDGFRVMAGYHIESYQDVVLMPDRINLPARVEQVNLGSSATYTTQDLRYEGWFLGASYQF